MRIRVAQILVDGFRVKDPNDTDAVLIIAVGSEERQRIAAKLDAIECDAVEFRSEKMTNVT